LKTKTLRFALGTPEMDELNVIRVKVAASVKLRSWQKKLRQYWSVIGSVLFEQARYSWEKKTLKMQLRE
jgi:hypothetical protein